MKKLLVILAMAALAVPCFAQANPAQTVPFDHWAYDAVQELVDQGIIIGYPDGTFKGDRAMTRYEFAIAISRLLDVIAPAGAGTAGEKGDTGPQGLKGDPGAQGEKGDAGEPGAAGKDATIDEAQIATIVNKLLDEFKDELADIRQDVDYLQDDVYDLGDRVTYLEKAMEGPKVFGWLDYRIGMANQIDFDYDFDNLTAVVGIEGQITDEVAGCIALKVRDNTPCPQYDEGGCWGVPPDDVPDCRPTDFTSAAESVWLDEAYITFTRDNFPRGTHTIGRQFVQMGPGLLVDTQRQSVQGWRCQTNDVLGSRLDLELFAGAANYCWIHTERDVATPDPISDGYVAVRLAYDSGRGEFGFNYLGSGSDLERGYSLDYTGSIWGRAIVVEHARQTQLRANVDPATTPQATMVSAELLGGAGWALTGFWSDADAGYNPYYSLMNPYYEVLGAGTTPAWERWLRNVPVMQNSQVLGGELDFSLAGTPFTFCYYNIASSSWALSTSKELADGVTATFTYASQGDGCFGTDDELLQGGVIIGF